MTTKHKRSILEALLSLCFLFLVTSAAVPQERAEVPYERYWSEYFERAIIPFYTGRLAMRRPCNVELTVNFVYLNPHLNVGDRLHVTGPIPGTGNYVVSPLPKSGLGMWDHPWKNGAYTAYAKPTDPNRFDMPGVAVTPHDNSPAASTHLFRMEVIEWDGDCPKHVVFEGSGHGVDFDDPGHAGASD